MVLFENAKVIHLCREDGFSKVLAFFGRSSPIHCGDGDVAASPRDRNRDSPCHLGGSAGSDSLSSDMEEDRW